MYLENWRCVFIEKVKEKKEIKQEIKSRGLSKPREMLHRGLQDGIEKAGKNIREAGEQPRQEEKPQYESAYGVDKTEAAAKSAASNAYAMGRKLAQKQRNSEQVQQPESVCEPAGESISEVPNCCGLPSASPTVSVGVNLSETSTHYAGNNGINPAKIKLKTEPEEPLAGSLPKNEASAKDIKERQNSQILEATDKKTVWEKTSVRVKPYVKTANIASAVSDKAAPAAAKIKEFQNRDIKTKAAEIKKAAAMERKNKPNANKEPLAGKTAGGSAVYSGNSAKQHIKTRESQPLSKNGDSDRATKATWEQGRRLAIKNLSEKKAPQQLDDVNAVEQIADAGYESNMPAGEVFSVQEQPISDATDAGGDENKISFAVQSSMLLPVQQKMDNIKTKEYEKNREMAVGSVRESNSARQKLFGKSAFNDVKQAKSQGGKSGAKASLAGVKEKSVAEKAYLNVQKAGDVTYYRDLKNNAFGYLGAKNNPAKRKGITQFAGRLVPNNAKEILAAIMGMGSVLAVVIIICLIAALFASPFGIFFSGADNMSDAVNELNAEFAQRIENIKAGNTYDELEMNNAGSSAMVANWPDVLAIYSVLTTMNDSNPYEAVTLDAAKKARLREVFWAMNPISYEVGTVYNTEIDAEIEVLYISVTEKDCWQLADEYNFTAEQRQMLAELKKPEYQEMFMALAGSYRDIALTPEEIEEIIANLPADLSEERRQAVLTAYQLEGKVNYFWGGKSLTLGWDSRWGTPHEVWAAGSATTGTIRSFGLDCSGFVDWVFYNASGGSFVMGRGGGAASQHSYSMPISWSEAQPGDLVFYPDDSHVGIVCGFDRRGNVQIIHCAAGYNNVVVTGKAGFTGIGRPDYFAD